MDQEPKDMVLRYLQRLRLQIMQAQMCVCSKNQYEVEVFTKTISVKREGPDL